MFVISTRKVLTTAFVLASYSSLGEAGTAGGAPAPGAAADWSDGAAPAASAPAVAAPMPLGSAARLSSMAVSCWVALGCF
jgi:hypothetical protein